MSKVTELLNSRKLTNQELKEHSIEFDENASSLDSYYEKVISEEEINKALKEYDDNIERLDDEFIERTSLKKEDLPYLFFATMLHVCRIFVINKLFNVEKAGHDNVKETKLKEIQNKSLKKLKNDDTVDRPYYASRKTIITTPGVPYDAIKGSKKFGLGLAGVNHRYKTLGHDPALGLIFGTGNILTNTITTMDKLPRTNHVKSGKILANASTSEMVNSSIDRLKKDRPSFYAAAIKQLIHIATDEFTPCGIVLPGSMALFNEDTLKQITPFIGEGDLVKAGSSALLSVMINELISITRQWTWLNKNSDSLQDNFTDDLYIVRTNKIIDIAMTIAQSSNIIECALSKDIKKMDWGGLLITICRIFNDTKFTRQLELEYINSGLKEIYNVEN